jgi:hypothetical protein
MVPLILDSWLRARPAYIVWRLIIYYLLFYHFSRHNRGLKGRKENRKGEIEVMGMKGGVLFEEDTDIRVITSSLLPPGPLSPLSPFFSLLDLSSRRI